MILLNVRLLELTDDEVDSVERLSLVLSKQLRINGA